MTTPRSHHARTGGAPAPQLAYTRLLAHELRTPITVLLGFAELLAAEAPHAGRETVHEYATVIHQRATNLARLIAELTTFNEVTAGRDLPAGTRPTSLSTILEQIRQEVDGSRALRVAVSPEAARSMSAGQVDVERLRLVLYQLLSNAFHHAPPGTEVAVRASVDGAPSRLVVQVSNDGPPIPPRQRKAIFRPFHQAEDLLTRRHRGLGLGLAVARRAAEGAGGCVELEPGLPTTFRLELPVREDATNREVQILQERAALADAQALRAIHDVRALRERAAMADAQALRAIRDVRALRERAAGV